MSGGHFNYMYIRLNDFIKELEYEIEANNNSGIDIDIHKYGVEDSYNFSDNTMNTIKLSKDFIRIAAELSKTIEYLYSGDYSEESFEEEIDMIMENIKNTWEI